MVFSSLIFLIIFLPAVLLVYYIAPQRFRNFVLLAVSLIFYGWGEPVYILLMLFSIVLNYSCGLLLGAARKRQGSKRALLAVNVFLNIGMLFIFKYADFTIGTFNILFGTHVRLLNIALPIGISFYTFQAMSYVIDVYRGVVKENKNFVNFAAYITMFPQLIAGPIVRYRTVERELRERKCTAEDFYQGILRFTTGLGKKVLIANNVALIFKEIADTPANLLSTSMAWLGVLAFTLQLYFDFSGYSDMAIGMGRMFGFHFLENFDYPYESGSVTEFWRRWHISLGTWFREYVYYPLGGNRKGLLRQVINIFIVWMLTGLWHGASWNFVLWGLYYALLLIAEKLFLGKLLKKIPAFFSRLYTMLAYLFGSAIFAYNDMSHGKSLIKALFFQAEQGLADRHTAYLLLSFGGLLAAAVIGSTSLPKRAAEAVFGRHPAAKSVAQLVFIVAVLIVSIAFLVLDTYNPFLYFRF